MSTPHLARVAAKLAARHPLLIVAFGSSTTEGVGASSPERSYPSLLPGELARLAPDQPPARVLNRGVGGEAIDEMRARLERDVLSETPDLVIWQMGTNAAMRRMDPAYFADSAAQGIAQLLAAGPDLLLMEPQGGPSMRTVRHSPAYRNAVRALGQRFNVPVLRRYDLMHRWGRRYNAPLVIEDGLHMTDLGYALLAQATARAILRFAKNAG